jgi:hypothetical protein
MKRFMMIMCGVVLTLGVVACALVVWMWMFGSEALQRADTPLKREEAVKQNMGMMLPLPISAQNVYYLDYAGGLQDLERYIALMSKKLTLITVLRRLSTKIIHA